MPEPAFSTLLPVRYGDLDAQGHVNHARFFTFMEHARTVYLKQLGLWDGRSFESLGLIVADAHVSYLAPIFLGQTVRVTLRVTHLGNKSLKMEYQLEDAASNALYARGDTVMVSYDYPTQQAVPIPDAWREKIAAVEGIPARASV